MRTATRLTVLALLAASALATPPAHAGVTVPVAHSLPKRVLVVGTDANGVPDPLGQFQVEVRSLGAGDPWPNGLLIASFGSTPDIAMCTTQPTNVAQYTGCFSGDAVTGVLTDANSTATLTIVGHGNRAAADAGAPSLKIYCDGVPIGTVLVAVLDQDGDGVGASDLALWQEDFFSNQYLERSDLDGSGALGAGDLAILLGAYFANRSSHNCAATCP